MTIWTRKGTGVLLGALALGATVLLYPGAKGRVPPVAAASNAAPEAKLIVAAGRTEPASEEVGVGSEIDGKLKAVLVEEGQSVRRGQPVALLENSDYVARVDLARASLREREAALDRLVNGARIEERREAAAVLRETEAVLENARSELDRRRALVERGAVSRVEFDAAEREYRVALARREAAAQRSALVAAEARDDERQRATSEVERARAQLAEAQAWLEKTVVRAPIGGSVLRRKLKSGESVSSGAGNPIVVLGDCSRLRVRVDVDEADVARLRVGQDAWVAAAAYGKTRFHGRVIRVGGALGRKNIRTDEPTERVDTKILETLVELDAGVSLPVGLRVDAFLRSL